MTEPFFFDETEILGARRPRGPRREAKLIGAGGCEECGLYSQCSSPCMDPYGECALGIAIVGMQPGEQEDEKGVPFVGPSGDKLVQLVRPFGLDLDKDCKLINAIQCYSAEKPPDGARLCCLPRLRKQLQALAPKLIICLGAEAASSVFGRPLPIGKVRGLEAVNRTYNCWVMATYHPAHLLRQESGVLAEDLERIWERDFDRGLRLLDADIRPRILDEDRGNHWITDEAEAIEILEQFSASTKPVEIDYETNQLDPFTGKPKITLVGLTDSAGEAWSLLVRDPISEKFHRAVADFLYSDAPKSAHNLMFELIWGRKIFGRSMRNLHRCSMLAAHLLDERKGNKSLDWLSFVNFGTSYKRDFGNPAVSQPDGALARYNCLDTRYGWALAQQQETQLGATLRRGENLYLAAIPMLADMTWNGVKVDPSRLTVLREKAQRDIQEAERDLIEMAAVKQTEIKTRRMFSFSEDDLRTLFYDVLGLPRLTRTKAKGQASIGVDALQEAVDELSYESLEAGAEASPYIDCLRRRNEWAKILSTYIEPWLKMRDKDDLLHPSFALHVARSFRSSSECPNFQNIPKRGQYADEVRHCVVPKLELFLEADYSGMEVRVLASISGDRNLLKDLEDGVDLHRYWASQIYEVPENQITDEERFTAKGSFVFARFYGASWKQLCQPPLNLPPKRARNLTGRFWGRYDDVKAWQKEMIVRYGQVGYVELVSGFRRHAPLDVLQIGNTPIQGSAFHVLLENSVRLWRVMRKRKMASHMVAETHDSLLLDVAEEETEEVLGLANKSLCRLPEWLPNPVELKLDWVMGEDWGSMEEV